ncbi:unnamed protein product, partial [Brassica rapa subsp. trilocularis]
ILSERHASPPPRLDRPRHDSPPEPHHLTIISSELRNRRASAETISVLQTCLPANAPPLETNKNQPHQIRNPNTRNRHEILKAGDAKLL